MAGPEDLAEDSPMDVWKAVIVTFDDIELDHRAALVHSHGKESKGRDEGDGGGIDVVEPSGLAGDGSAKG